MRARGGFYNQVETFPSTPTGIVLGQGTQDSCVAACCRMLLDDYYIVQPEAFLREALKIDQGAYLSELPAVLGQFGLPLAMAYRNDLTIEELAAVVERAPAVVFVRSAASAGHALVVDELGELISIRDPLPQGRGSAYRIRRAVFELAWLRAASGRGQAVIAIG